MEKKKLTKEEEKFTIPDDKWDFYSGLPNPMAYVDDDVDEDHSLDKVLNDMVDGLDDDDYEWFPDSKT